MANASSPIPSKPCPHCGELHSTTFSHCPNTGRALTTGEALIGRLVGDRYRVLGLLGEGGMGAVYLAEHTLIGRKVALKRLHPELSTEARSLARFRREARATAAIGNEHIVDIIDLGEADDGAPFIVMEYLRGATLAELIRKEGRLAPARACRIIGQLLAALAAVHDKDIVHRDLKPENIFLIRKGDDPDFVKVLDFGVSKMRSDDGLDLTKTGVMLGTPFYMSPEQARGKKDLDHRVDLYAVGVLLYEALSGQLPHRADNYHALLAVIMATDATPLREILPSLDEGLAAAVKKAIDKKPSERFQSASEMQRALVPYGAQPPDEGRAGFARGMDPGSGFTRAVRGMADTLMAGIPRPSGMAATPRHYAKTSDDWEDDGLGLLPESGAPAPHGEVIRGATGRSGARWRAAPGPASLVRESSGSFRALGDTTASESKQPVASDPPPASSTAPRVRGAMLSAALNHIERSHGPAGKARVLAALAPTLRSAFSGGLPPRSWFGLDAYDAILAAADQVVGDGDGRAAVAVGEALAAQELPSALRRLISSYDAEGVLTSIPSIYRNYHDRGEVEVRGAPSGGHRVTVRDTAQDTMLHAMAMSGFYRAILRHVGAREVRAAVLSCRGRGDDATVISLRFT